MAWNGDVTRMASGVRIHQLRRGAGEDAGDEQVRTDMAEAPTVFNLTKTEQYTPPDGTFLLTYRGSIAHNLYVPKSDPTHIDDVDLLGGVIAGRECYLGLRQWGSRGTKEHKQGQYDVVLYEIRKLLSLLLQGNPNVLGTLWVHPQHVIHASEAGRRLIAARSFFVGKHVYKPFTGYAAAQLAKMESREPAALREYLDVTAELKYRGIHPNHKGEHVPLPDGHPVQYGDWSAQKLIQRLRTYQKKGENIGYMGEKRKRLVLEHGYDTKNAAHLIRLLRMGAEFLATGEMLVYRTDDRQELLDIKAGKWSLEEVKTEAERGFAACKEALAKSTLPEKPNRDRAEALLVETLEAAL